MPSMRWIFLGLAVSAMVLVAGRSSPVQAFTTYEFTAVQFVYTAYPIVISDFSLRYVDADNDGRFSLDELVSGSFSGVSIEEPGWSAIYMTIHWVAAGPLSPLTDELGYVSHWSFGDPIFFVWEHGWDKPLQVGLGEGDFSYSQVAVPLPASVFLLGSGLIGLAWARRKKRLGQ